MGTPARASTKRQRELVTKRVTVTGVLQRACDEFNAGLFFECHETLEEIWQEEQGEVRDLYKGLIQLAAAFVHVTRRNYIGAERLLRTGVAYLTPYRLAGAMGIDVERICMEAELARSQLVRLGSAGIAGFDLAFAPTLGVDLARLPDDAVRWAAWGFDDEGRALEMTITVIE